MNKPTDERSLRRIRRGTYGGPVYSTTSVQVTPGDSKATEKAVARAKACGSSEAAAVRSCERVQYSRMAYPARIGSTIERPDGTAYRVGSAGNLVNLTKDRALSKEQRRQIRRIASGRPAVPGKAARANDQRLAHRQRQAEAIDNELEEIAADLSAPSGSLQEG